MKSKLLAIMCLGIVIAACNKDKSEVAPVTKKTYSAPHSAGRLASQPVSEMNSAFIPKDVANQMINSYLYSINSSANDSDVRSFSINADSLRAYLSDPSVKSVKLILAHTMSYISAGNSGLYAGYQSGAMTIIVAGYNESGTYVYHGGNYVLDHCTPCPFSCPPGDAASYLLQ